MWAILDKKTQIVLGVLAPDTPLEIIETMEQTNDLVFMTPENSPASIGDEYKEGKFKRMEN
jgi:hypothetical protein